MQNSQPSGRFSQLKRGLGGLLLEAFLAVVVALIAIVLVPLLGQGLSITLGILACLAIVLWGVVALSRRVPGEPVSPPPSAQEQACGFGLRIGKIAIFTIIALRLVVGWHFFQEGAVKIIGDDFRSEGFMRVAKGPLTPFFRALIWDGDGRIRLDKDRTLDIWNQYRQQVVNHYGFDEKQAKEAEEKFKYRKRQLEYLFAEEGEDINKYLKGLERLKQYRQDPMRMGVTSLRGQIDRIEKEMSQEVGPWLASIDLMWEGLESDLNGLATEEQARRGELELGKPGRRWYPPFDTLFIDQIIPTFDLVVGVFLILGLFTRVSALAGAGFLAMIIATQWPGAPGALPAHYQIIEMVSMLVLAAVAAGRVAGLDFLLHALRARCFPPKTESTNR